MIVKVIDTIEQIAYRALSTLTVLCLLGLSGVVLLQVFARLFLESSPVWTEELSRYLFIYTITCAVGIAFRDGQLVSVDMIKERLSGPLAAIYRLILDVVVLGFCVMVLPSASQFMNIGQFQTSPTLFVPMHFIFASTVIIFANLALFVVLDLLRTLVTLFDKGPSSWK